jgi:hypothetical protein
MILLTQNFSENEDKNHADVESWLLGCSADTSVSDDTNGETGFRVSSRAQMRIA